MESRITKPVAFATTNASVLLDLVRGLAALVVLLEHWRYILFIDFPQLSKPLLPLVVLYFLCTAGHQAVVVFFVLSGYLISGSVFRLLARNKWSWRTYLMHRLLRLWIVLLPGLLLCALWDGVGLHFHVAPGLYNGLSGNHMTGNVGATYTLRNFLGNLLFLQTISVPTFGSDGALWSLTNEFWYYILFPIGFLVVKGAKKLLVRAVYGILFAVVMLLVGRNVLEGFPIWLLGTGLALLPVPPFSKGTRIISAVVYVPVFFLLGRATRLPQLLNDYLLAVFTFIFLWILLSATGAREPSLGTRFSRTLSRFSFTLYVGHMPLCVLLTGVFVGDQRWTPDAGHLLLGVAILFVLLSYAYLIAALTEFRTDKARRWLEIQSQWHASEPR